MQLGDEVLFVINNSSMQLLEVKFKAANINAILKNFNKI